MNKVQLILTALKPKAKSLGFSSKELQEVAEAIAPNLNVTDESTDEDVNAAVEATINAVLPILGMGQKQANRMLERYKQNHPETDPKDPDPKDTDPKDPDPKDPSNAYTAALKEMKEQMAAQMAEMKKAFNEQLKASNEQSKAMSEQLKAMQGEKVKAQRQKKLEELVKDSGKYGEGILKNYSRMNFDLEKEDEFETFLTETKENLDAFKQELADKGLASLGQKPGGTSGDQDKEPFTDEEIDDMATLMA